MDKYDELMESLKLDKVMVGLGVDKDTAEQIVEIALDHYDGDIDSAEFALRESGAFNINVDHYVEIEGQAANLGVSTNDLIEVAKWAKFHQIFD